MKPKKKDSKGIRGWLVVVMALFILIFFESVYMLAQRLTMIILDPLTSLGIYISVGILIVVIFFNVQSIILMIKRKKKAVDIGVASLVASIIFVFWYNIIGVLIFYSGASNLFFLVNGVINAAINAAVFIAVILYLKKSKRVKDTLVK
jgi:hypothetical protein